MSDPLMSSANPDWQTPPEFLDLVRKLGPIALDPATTEDNPTGAAAWFWRRGTLLSWKKYAAGGLVYVNPPYGRGVEFWTEKMVLEASEGVEIVALLPARTDTQWFRDLQTADSLCFWYGRIRFVGAKSGAPFPNVVAYWGHRPGDFDTMFRAHGWCIHTRRWTKPSSLRHKGDE